MTQEETATVLVVDDEPELAGLITRFLESEYDVRTATSGPEALELADQEVDVVLLDRRMPEMSGDEVLEELTERGIDTQVAMLTGMEPDIDIVEMPFDDYRTKPVRRSDVLPLVEVLLIRSTFDERSQRFFRLASKKVALEKAENDDSDEYRELVDRMTDVRVEIDGALDAVSDENAEVGRISNEM